VSAGNGLALNLDMGLDKTMAAVDDLVLQNLQGAEREIDEKHLGCTLPFWLA